MPDEVFIIVIVAILAGTFSSVVKSVIGYLSAKSGSVSSESSLTSSELKRLVAEAVLEANASLEERFERLETRLDRQLPPASEHGALDAPVERSAARTRL